MEWCSDPVSEITEEASVGNVHGVTKSDDDVSGDSTVGDKKETGDSDGGRKSDV
jgi:hypothetical protein